MALSDMVADRVVARLKVQEVVAPSLEARLCAPTPGTGLRARELGEGATQPGSPSRCAASWLRSAAISNRRGEWLRPARHASYPHRR